MNRNLTENLKHLASELRLLDQQFKAEPAPDLPALQEFRQALDGVRLTAWSVNELIHARYASKNSDTVFSFLVSQRLRRFEQMVNNLCSDLDLHALPVPDSVLQPIAKALHALQQRLEKRNIIASKQ